ncbi:hypothetical protein PFISCL1PPCAC_22268, partial [Pristionchus fissidentatus]
SVQMLRLGKLSTAIARSVHLTIDKPTDRSSAHAEQCATVRSLIGHQAIGGVIGHPMPRDVATIVIIIDKQFVEPVSSPSVAAFQEVCKILQLKIKSIDVPDGELIEQCVKYTLCIWLEPDWCRVGDALMQSAFLYRSRNSPNDRLAKIEVAVSYTAEGEVLLSLSPSLVRVYIVEPWFISDAAALRFDPKWACCLPKLGKGKIVGVHKSLPADCPFKSWAHVRHYWGNAYGYHLPDAEPEAYYDVLFNGMKKTMIYPHYCVISGEPETAPFRLAAEAASQTISVFMATINRRRARMLGEEVRVAVSPAAAGARLAYASAAPLPVVRKARKIKYASSRHSLAPATAFKEEQEGEGEEEEEEQPAAPAAEASLHRTINNPIAKASPAATGGYGTAAAAGYGSTPAASATYKPKFGASPVKKPVSTVPTTTVPPPAPAPTVPTFAARKKNAATATAAAPAVARAKKAQTGGSSAPAPTPRRKRAGITVE